MFRPIPSQMSKAIRSFPKMSSINYPDSSNWSMPKIDALSWSQTSYPTNMTTKPLQYHSTHILKPSHTPIPPLSLPPNPSPNPSPITPSPNKSRIESYDQWFERCLNDKTDDMFLL